MKLFVWEQLDTGAYHGDGVAVVIAETLGDAINLLQSLTESHYDFSKPASTTEPKKVIEIGQAERQILLVHAGCDC